MRFQLDKRNPFNINKIPQHLINAFIATEDWSFFKHSGLLWKGIIRSILYNIYYRRKVQGASTITQQLIRLLFFDIKKRCNRKIKEQIYALLVEQQFTKLQILEAYLNHVYFGCSIYRVEAASQRFWKKSV
jgi:penicillin-binding protein 1A